MSEALQYLADRVADGKESAPVLAVLIDHEERIAALESATTATAAPVAESTEE